MTVKKEFSNFDRSLDSADYVTQHTLRENVHTNSEIENSGKGNHKHKSTRKESDAVLLKASKKRLGISVNQPLRWRGHWRQPCLVTGS